MKKLNESYMKERIMSTPIFVDGVLSQKDIINSEISSLEILAGMIKGRQLEFFSSNNNENDFENVLNSLDNFKNNLNKSLMRLNNEKEFFNKKVLIFYFYIYQNEERIKEVEDKVEKNYEQFEQLENLNFSIQNEIKKIDYLSNKTKDRIYFLRTIEFFQEEKREFFISNNKGVQDVENFLKNEIIRLKKYDKELKEKIKIDEDELKELKFKVDRYQKICQSQKFDKKYISTTEVIEEELTQNNQISQTFNTKDNQEKCKENDEISNIPKGLRRRTKSANSFEKILENNEYMNKVDNIVLKQKRRLTINNINKKRMSLPKIKIYKSKSINLEHCNLIKLIN